MDLVSVGVLDLGRKRLMLGPGDIAVLVLGPGKAGGAPGGGASGSAASTPTAPVQSVSCSCMTISARVVVLAAWFTAPWAPRASVLLPPATSRFGVPGLDLFIDVRDGEDLVRSNNVWGLSEPGMREPRGDPGELCRAGFSGFLPAASLYLS